MRGSSEGHSSYQSAACGRAILLFALVAAVLSATGCGGVTGGNPPPPPPPPPISVSVAPPSAAVPLGATQQFTATVSNTSNTAVAWSVNGIPGGNSSVGTISANGLYTAPQNLPPPGTVSITATSQADSTKSASASVSVTSDVVVGVSPATAGVELGATRQFTAAVTASGNPNRAVTWSVSGAGCAAAACGTIDSAGLYTAPQILPAPPSVTLTARSVADAAKSATAVVTITSSFTLALSGPASVIAGASATYTAALTPAPNSNPSLALTWSVSGPGCAGAACGTITSTGASTASYTAPAVAPSLSTVNVTATPAADPSKAASLQITITSVITITVQLSPGSSTRAVSHRQTFTVTVSGTPNQNVSWQVNGIAGGNPTVGQICVVSSNPCQQVTATNGGSVDYLAPDLVPSLNPVTLSATSQADSTKSAAASVTILPHIVVSVAPPSATLALHSTQLFTATVLGTNNQNVVWQVTGPGCGGAGSPCGTVDFTGFYTAPLAQPTPNTLSVVAISSEDTSRSGSAAVTIAPGAAITRLLPASATSGAAGGFTLLIQGSNFVASSPGPGSTILFNSTAKLTTCSSASECSATLTASDVTTPGSFPIQIRNPDNTASNQVLFVVVAQAASEDIIQLTAAAPSASGKDILVVEPSTAGTSSDLNLNVLAAGFFLPATNTCVLGSSPMTLARPASGTTSLDVCAFSLSGLDPALNYIFTGPSPNDVTIVAKQPLGLGIIHLTLQISSTTLPGPRTLFIENANKDKTAVTGAFEVK